MQLPQQKIEDSGLSPSFNCYSSDSITSTAIAKAIREEEEEEASRFHETGGFGGDDFEFSLAINDEEVSAKEIDSRGSIVFPVFNRDLLVNREIKATDDEIDASSAVTGSLGNVFIGEREEASSNSSLEHPTSGSYCMWRPKAEGGSSPVITTWKKSRSTGSGSKRWILFRYLLRRINGGGKEPIAMVTLTPKKMNSSKQKRNCGVHDHEQFYLRRRAESEFGKRKSYLPYRTVLVGM